MGIIGSLVIIWIGYLIYKACINSKVDDYDMSKVSSGKMTMDVGKSKLEIQRNLINGKYDKDDNWKI